MISHNSSSKLYYYAYYLPITGLYHSKNSNAVFMFSIEIHVAIHPTTYPLKSWPEVGEFLPDEVKLSAWISVLVLIVKINIVNFLTMLIFALVIYDLVT